MPENTENTYYPPGLKKTKPKGGKWADVIEPVPPPDGGYDPDMLPEGWAETCTLDGERLLTRGLRDQLYSWDAKRISVVVASAGGAVRPFKEDYEDEGYGGYPSLSGYHPPDPYPDGS